MIAPSPFAFLPRPLGEAYARAETGTLDRDWKTQLQELGQARHRSSPRYRVVAEVGPDHAKTFEIEVELRGTVLGRGSGRSKKDAEQAAARVALEALAAPAVPVVPEPEPIPPPADPLPAPPAPAIQRVAKTAKVDGARPRKPRKPAKKARSVAARPAPRKKAGKRVPPRKAPARRSRKIADPGAGD